MKRLKVKDSVVSDRQFKKYFTKYVQKHGYDTPVHLLPHDIVTELLSTALMCFSAIDLKIDEEFELEMAEEIIFKCKKIGKYHMVIEKESMCQALDIPSDDPDMEVLINPANHRILDKSEDFVHPLTEIKDVEVDGEVQSVLDGYAVASLVIRAIRNPEETGDNGRKAREFLTRTVLESGKTINVSVLIEKIKAGRLQAMMEASTLIHDGFHNIAHRQFGK